MNKYESAAVASAVTALVIAFGAGFLAGFAGFETTSAYEYQRMVRAVLIPTIGYGLYRLASRAL